MRESGGNLCARIHNGGICLRASPRAIGPVRGIDATPIVDAVKKDYLMGIVRSILPEAGDVLPAKEKIHRFPGEIMQLMPEADAVAATAP
jgi:hypothetical protein